MNEKLNVLDLFAGIGGFSLGLERTGGFNTVAFCEIEQYPRTILKRHWPNVPQYKDIRKLTDEGLKKDGIEKIQVITGGFPCQDISFAGKGAGIEGKRSGLWYEYARLIDEIRPEWAIIENNSPAIFSRGLVAILQTLHSIGYACEWNCIPASHVGAPHKRDRIWIVAYPNDSGPQRGKLEPGQRSSSERETAPMGNTNHPRLQGLGAALERARERAPWKTGKITCGADGKRRLIEPAIPLMADGIPHRVERIRTSGNTIVPLIPQAIGEAILEWLKKTEVD